MRRMARISVGQHREQIGVRIAGWRATKVQAPEVIWNLPVATRVAVVVVVDDHGHDEAPTQNASAIALTASLHSRKT